MSAAIATSATTTIDAIPSHYTMEDVAHFSRWGHVVHGWFKTTHDIAPRAGVLVVATQAAGSIVVIDVIEDADINQAALAHSRAAQWRKHATGGLQFGAIYLDKGMSSFLSRFMRSSVAGYIRSVEHPICGESDVLA